MPTVSLQQLLQHAQRGGYAVGYFESWDVYSLEAVLAAAEMERSPVIIGLGGLSANSDWLNDTGIDVYGRVSAALASRASVPVAVLLNEADSFEQAAAGLGAGYNAVMMHTQGWEWERLIADTRALTAAAHGLDIAVEGEVGALAEMREGKLVEAGAQFTSVEQATAFVEATQVDCLAVAVGNVHFITDDDHLPQVDTQRIRELNQAVDVPLVLHGGSGTPDDQVRQAIDAGIAKINVGTRLKHVFGRALHSAMDERDRDPNLTFGSRYEGDVHLSAAAALRDEVRRLMNVYGSTGKAEQA